MLFQQRKVQHSLLSHGPHWVNSRRVQWRRRRAGSEGGVRGRGQRAGSEGGVRGYGHHGYRIRRRCLPFFFPHFSLTPFSINNHQFLLFLLLFSICLPLFPKFSPPKHSRSPSLPLSVHSLAICSLCQLFICHSVNMAGPLQTIPHQFRITTSHHSNFHSQFVHSSLISFLNTHDSSYPNVTCAFSCYFSVSTLVSRQ